MSFFSSSLRKEILNNTPRKAKFKLFALGVIVALSRGLLIAPLKQEV